jgi:uncharacterized protein YbaP (TraB family)
MTHLDDRPGRRRAAYLALALTIAGLAAALTGQAQSNQRSFVWKAAGPRGSVYLVGSVHLLTKDYYPLSAALEAAFADSDLLVEEVDLGEMLKPESQLQTMARGLLPSGQSLDKVVSAETMRLVSQRASSLGLPIEPLKRFKPWSLALMLLGAEWQKSGFDPSLGLDRHFYDQARSQGKAVKGLETVEFQLSRFDEMSGEQQERLLVQSLKEADTQPGTSRRSRESYSRSSRRSRGSTNGFSSSGIECGFPRSRASSFAHAPPSSSSARPTS